MALGHGRGALSPLSFYVPLVPSGAVDVSETLVSLIPDEWQQEEDFESFLQSLLPDDPLEGILALFDEIGIEDYPEPDFLAQFLDEPVVVLDDPEARIALFDDYQDEEREPDFLAQFIEDAAALADDPEARVALYEDYQQDEDREPDFFAQFLDVPDVVPDVPRPDPGRRPYRGFNLEDWKRNRKPLKDLEDDLEALYWELTKAPAEIQAEAARIVRPFALTEQEFIAPSAVNWKALIEQVEAIQALYALEAWREEDDIEYLLLNS